MGNATSKKSSQSSIGVSVTAVKPSPDKKASNKIRRVVIEPSENGGFVVTCERGGGMEYRDPERHVAADRAAMDKVVDSLLGVTKGDEEKNESEE